MNPLVIRLLALLLAGGAFGLSLKAGSGKNKKKMVENKSPLPSKEKLKPKREKENAPKKDVAESPLPDNVDTPNVDSGDDNESELKEE